jgi:hypothetical protein
MLDIHFEYDESFGASYNYELGNLEALREALRLALIFEHQDMVKYLKKRIEEQKKLVFQEIPDDIKDIQGWNNLLEEE